MGIENVIKDTMGKRQRVTEKVEPVKKPKSTPEVVEEDQQNWECEGLLWEDPPLPCPKGEKANFKKKEGCMWNKKRHVICRNCKNALSRKKRAEKKEKEQNGN